MDHSEYVFLGVETMDIDSTSAIVEFGAILVCPNTLTELRNYSTLVRPDYPFLIPPLFQHRKDITRDALAAAPTFADIADTVYELLHERIWAGHDIVRFDCVPIRKAFREMNWPPPEPKAIVDSSLLFTQTFKTRAGDMKMASLATYFELGQQTHGSILDDIRMNLEVLKRSATVLFLESSLSNILTVNNSVVSPNATPRSRSSGKSVSDTKVKPTLLSPAENQCKHKGNDPTYSPTTESKHFDLGFLRDELNRSVMVDNEKPIIPKTPNKSSSPSPSSSSSAAVSSPSDEVILNPDELLMSHLTASLVPLYRGSQRIQLLHKGVPFRVCCVDLKIRFGINGKFQDYAGRPKLNFVVDLDPSQPLCKVLEDCDKKAQKLSLESGSSSEWRPLVTRKDGYCNYPTLRLQIPSAESGSGEIYATEICKRDSSGTMKRIVFDKFDVAELASMFKPGSFVHAVLSFDSYDYQQSAGIRLIAKRLIVL